MINSIKFSKVLTILKPLSFLDTSMVGKVLIKRKDWLSNALRLKVKNFSKIIKKYRICILRRRRKKLIHFLVHPKQAFWAIKLYRDQLTSKTNFPLLNEDCLVWPLIIQSLSSSLTRNWVREDYRQQKVDFQRRKHKIKAIKLYRVSEWYMTEI